MITYTTTTKVIGNVCGLNIHQLYQVCKFLRHYDLWFEHNIKLMREDSFIYELTCDVTGHSVEFNRLLDEIAIKEKE